MKSSAQSFPALLLLLHAAAGGLCVLASLLVRTRPEILIHWGWLVRPLVIVGLLFLLAGILLRRTSWVQITAPAALSCSAVLLATAAGEAAFRLAGYDFRRQEALWRRHPPFYRQPMVPTGKVYFRRNGPEQWTGAVVRTWLELSHRDPSPYASEQPITVSYDPFGFRNDIGLSDWEMAVAGDSFTELGYLRQEDLFTTLLGQRLGLRVRNLGVSYTGPLTQLSYLEEYGQASSLRHTVIVFFEGNDFADLSREYRALLNYEATGKRPTRPFRKQTSLLRAMGERLRTGRKPPGLGAPQIDAVFASSAGPVPVTLGLVPDRREEITAFMLEGFNRFAADYAAFGKTNQVQIWLAYMPCKARVLFDRLTMNKDAADQLRDWTPNDVPSLVASLCARHGIGFVDLTPPLIEETIRTGELLFNALYDTHLNARGSAVVAAELSNRLSAPP